jgi:hypothetical protein
MIGWTREVTELVKLGLAKFTELSESELKVLVAVTSGEYAYCGPSRDDNHPDNNPESADNWGVERDIRAELIRWLCISRDAAAWLDPRGLQVHGTRISGELDFSFAVVRFPLLLVRCCISDEMNLRFAQIDFLALPGSLVPGLSADGMRVRGSLNLRDGFRADGEVRLLGVYIGGNLDCDAGKFINPGGKALSADRVKVTGSVFLNDGFQAEGEVRLGADIGGNLDCSGGKFVKLDGHALDVAGARVGGDVFLNIGFSAEGEVNLVGASIGGDCVISGAEFAVGSRLDLERAIVKGGFFWRGLGANGKAALNLSHAAVGPIADDKDSWPTTRIAGRRQG